MTVSEKHINAAMRLNSLAQECLILDKSSEEAVSAIAAALAAAEREGREDERKRSAEIAADFEDEDILLGQDVAEIIRNTILSQANTHSPDTPGPGTISPETATRRLDDLGSVQDGLKMSSDGRDAGVLKRPDGERLPVFGVTAGRDRHINSHSVAPHPPGATEAGEAVPQALNEASPAIHHASRNGEG